MSWTRVFGDIPYQTSAGAYTGQIGGAGSLGNLPLFISNSGGGTFTFDDGSGGTDVGAFSVNLALASPLLAWPQRTSLERTTVSRSGGLTLTWSNGNAGSFVQISGRSVSADSSSVPAQFTCSVPAAAGQFTIPATVLLALPPSNPNPDVSPILVPLLQVSQASLPQPFSAPNLDFASVRAVVSITIVAYYE